MLISAVSGTEVPRKKPNNTVDIYCTKYPWEKDPVGMCTKPNPDALCQKSCSNGYLKGKCLILPKKSPKKMCYCWIYEPDGSANCQ